jgi:NADH:ubiquinone oxidoreductase subunit 4 (subunit M)
MLFSAIYSIWLYNRLIFGEIKSYNFINNTKILYFNNWLLKFADLTKRELMLITPFLLLNFFLGFYPNIVFNISYFSLLDLIN